MKVALTRGFTMECDPVTYTRFLLEIGSSLHADIHGYAIYSLKGKLYKFHRWVVSCTDPRLFVEHIDANPCNNWESNLRIVTPADNRRNCNDRLQKNNSTGYRGVYWSNRDRMYFATIGFENKLYPLGNFKTIEEAISARKKAEIKFSFTG